jgi:hypothetical protein
MRAERFAIGLVVAALAMLALSAPMARADDAVDPVHDAKAFRDYFVKKFP